MKIETCRNRKDSNFAELSYTFRFQPYRIELTLLNLFHWSAWFRWRHKIWHWLAIWHKWDEKLIRLNFWIQSTFPVPKIQDISFLLLNFRNPKYISLRPVYACKCTKIALKLFNIKMIHYAQAKTCLTFWIIKRYNFGKVKGW